MPHCGPGLVKETNWRACFTGMQAQQHLVGDGEHGAVGADAKRERKERDDGEQRASPQIAYGVKKILQHP